MLRSGRFGNVIAATFRKPHAHGNNPVTLSEYQEFTPNTVREIYTKKKHTENANTH